MEKHYTKSMLLGRFHGHSRRTEAEAACEDPAYHDESISRCIRERTQVVVVLLSCSVPQRERDHLIVHRDRAGIVLMPEQRTEYGRAARDWAARLHRRQWDRIPPESDSACSSTT